MSDNDGVLLEDMNANLKLVLEATAALSGVPAQLQSIESRIERVESQTKRIPAIEAAIKDQTHQLKDHELRLTIVEQAA